MSSHPAPRSLFTGLVDDAAVFPPGLAPMPQAVREHPVYRSAWYSDLIGPLLVPVAQLDAFTQSVTEQQNERQDLDGDPHAGADRSPMRISLIADAKQQDPLPGLLGALTALSDPASGVPAGVVAVEIAVPKEGDQLAGLRRVIDSLDRFLPQGVQGWVEVHRNADLPEALATIAKAPAHIAAKFRTGGIEAHLFPSTAELAAVLHRAVEVGVPLKLTAGLHNAVRHTAEATGFTHHGFANVLAAVAVAQDGGQVDDLDEVLAITEAEPLADRLRGLDEEGARAVRSTFVSFGCCGVTDPVDDLVAMGLLEPHRP
ncbi:MAG TPA: hypothetical protein VFX33_11220 [Actinomycetales bacterium]|nr:hypothetical protein [Actinomycetales bacterium]